MNALVLEGKYPVWDETKGKLVNHYKSKPLSNTLIAVAKLEQDMRESSDVAHTKLSSIMIARIISNLRSPPTPVLTWAHRVLRIYKHKLLMNAVIEGTVGARFALSDLANRTTDIRFKPYLEKACKGQMTNAQFREVSKSLNGDKS